MRICCACTVHVYIIITFHRERWEIAGTTWSDGGANEMMIHQRNNEMRRKKQNTNRNCDKCDELSLYVRCTGPIECICVVLYRNVLVCTVYGVVYGRWTVYDVRVCIEPCLSASIQANFFRSEPRCYSLFNKKKLIHFLIQINQTI